MNDCRNEFLLVGNASGLEVYVMHMVVYILLPTKNSRYFCKSIVKEMRDVSWYLRKYRSQGLKLKAILTTPTPSILAKKYVPKLCHKLWGRIQKSIEIKGLPQRIKSTDFYGIRTPSFMAYEPRLLCHMSHFHYAGGGGLQHIEKYLFWASSWHDQHGCQTKFLHLLGRFSSWITGQSWRKRPKKALETTAKNSGDGALKLQISVPCRRPKTHLKSWKTPKTRLHELFRKVCANFSNILCDTWVRNPTKIVQEKLIWIFSGGFSSSDLVVVERVLINTHIFFNDSGFGIESWPSMPNSFSGPLRLRVQSRLTMLLRIAASITFWFCACFKGVFPTQ